jgi:hypothetical protein
VPPAAEHSAQPSATHPCTTRCRPAQHRHPPPAPCPAPPATCRLLVPAPARVVQPVPPRRQQLRHLRAGGQSVSAVGSRSVRSRTSKLTSKQDCAASFTGSLAGGASIMAFVLVASLASRMSRMPRMGSAGRVRSTSHTAEAKAAWTPCAARYARDIEEIARTMAPDGVAVRVPEKGKSKGLEIGVLGRRTR